MKLSDIQQKLKAPKNQRNSFGNYNYRNCEDILEALKPLLGDSILTISDEMVQLGDRFYVKATASISWREESESVSQFTVTAYARESLEKKGMDSAQITGAASSYARKYALNGLFLIDDTKDADTQDNTEKRESYRSKATTVDDASDDVEEMLKQGIKDMMLQLKKPLSKTVIKEMTKLEYEPKNYDAIYKKLKITLEETDPLEAAFPSDKK